MMTHTEVVLQHPMVLAWILKEFVKECKEMDVEDIVRKNLPLVHRKVTYGKPFPLKDLTCYFYDLDVLMDADMEKEAPGNQMVYVEERRYWNAMDKDFYLFSAEYPRRGYKIAVDTHPADGLTRVENYTLKMSDENGEPLEIPNGFEFAHMIHIQLGDTLGEETSHMVSMLYLLLKEELPPEERAHRLKANYGIEF